ncbi:small-conductance mechanosensitive channel [Xenococcus sp. PCC 7305]|uniref:mechanosensitive ion channel family protein n=1 Tax=Xenococcus sp. PCC 7305 TaxID=102125 RepID=UPI0002AC0A4C|nr:mechanosensitive ion channel family protein [Xenococcus sp. PCC 7305]ELS05246.1 small-conductance mechanosensitive channel [Xenococcus sp. PCC 7305]
MKNIKAFLFNSILTIIVICSLTVVMTAQGNAQETPILEYNSRQQELVISQAPNDQEQTDTDQQNSPEEKEQDSEEKSDEEVVEASVLLDGQAIFTFKASLGEFSPEQRAKNTANNLEKVAQDTSILIDSLRLDNLEGLQVIQAKDLLITGFGQADAEVADLSLSELGKQRLSQIQEAISQYREARTQESVVRDLFKALGSTIATIFLIFTLNRILPSLFQRFQTWQQQRVSSINIQGLQFLSSSQINQTLGTVYKIIRFFLILFILYLYIPFLLSCFPWTRAIGIQLLDTFWNSVNLIFGGLFGYLPNLIIIGLIIFLSYYAIEFCRFFFKAIRRGRIKIRGFYSEWAEPTAKIVQFLIIALAGILIFPYLPASDSPGFQGVSVFIGALITLGSTTVIGNFISGIFLIYTRAFQLGDIIQANGQKGRVVEKTILSTRIITPDNEMITIPNASLFVSDITNYSSVIRDTKQPLIVKTTITLGYDVPWRKVYQVLVDAAKSTEGITQDPEPFVWQTSLDDFYVSYALKAYTMEPEKMGAIYSQLHQNIQDKCNEADIEILSPHYSAVRDGHQTTIPADYLPEDYKAPGFRMESLKKFFPPQSS